MSENERSREVIMSQKVNCEIIGLVTIPRKNKMKNVHLPKISLLVQMGEEI